MFFAFRLVVLWSCVAITAMAEYHPVPRARRNVRDGQNVRRGNKILMWPAGGPKVDDIVNSPYLLRPEVAATLYAITKCNNKWPEDLFVNFKVDAYGQEAVTDYPVVYFFGPDFSRYAAGFHPPNLADSAGSTWPLMWQTGLEAIRSLTGSEPPTSLGRMLQVVTGLPSSTYTKNQYTQETLRFAIIRAGESPVLIKASPSAKKLSPKSLYAIKNFSSDQNNTIELWTGPKSFGGKGAVVTATVSELLQDIDSVSHITDFKRWTPGKFGLCYQRTDAGNMTLSCGH